MSEVLTRLTSALADRYRIERELGQGGMATVYLAHDIRHGRDVAIKVLHSDLGAALGGERFLTEIRTTARLQHPHILPLLDSGSADGLLYYVMPLVTGETLRARLERETQLPIDDSVLVAREVADALHYAHSLGIIHRDIKPENILLQNGHAVVADFGIALAVQQAGGQRMTQTGLSLGTPQYMSPEQATGERVIDARSDVYALGAVTYEMLVGEPPFTGPSVQAIVSRVMTEEPRGLVAQRKAIPPAIEDAVLRALEKLPADRFSTAGEFGAALDSRATSATRALRAHVTTTRDRRAIVAVSTLATAFAAAALWGWTRPQASLPVVRYMLTVDSVAQVHDWMGEIAVSPDGATIAYGSDGGLQLRRRNEIGFTPVPATDGATSPCFSPNGSQVAFWRHGKVIAMSVAGGPQVTLADSLDVPESCSWGEDGYLYRAVTMQGLASIVRAKPEPGAPTTVITRVDTTAGETAIYVPEALPNGKAVLFHVDYRNGKTAIVAAEIPSGRRKVVVPQALRARYAHSGHLLYTTSDGKLWSVAFDQNTLETRGDPKAVGDGVPTTMIGPTDFAISKSGTLAYAADLTSTRTELLLVSRTGREEPVDSTWIGTFASPALSRDGSRLAVTVIKDGDSHIWIKPLAGGPAQKLTLENGTNQEASFTPDGRSVSFVRLGSSTSKSNGLFVQPLDGGGRAVALLRTNRMISEHAWSPAGGVFAVRTTTSEAGAGDILAASTSVAQEQVTPIVASSRSEYSPTISPDGRFMAYASNESGRFEVYVVPFPDPGNTKWQVTNTGGRAPRWSRRGGEIFYIDLSSNLVAARVTTSPGFAVHGRSVLFNAAAYSILAISRHSFDVMPDDQHFLMIRRRGGSPNAQMTVVENWHAEVRETKKQ
jgi:eukaryotic-like serine/threonine-protein kinase